MAHTASFPPSRRRDCQSAGHPFSIHIETPTKRRGGGCGREDTSRPRLFPPAIENRGQLPSATAAVSHQSADDSPDPSAGTRWTPDPPRSCLAPSASLSFCCPPLSL